MHGLITGNESRQQLYTMLTRGRSANHIYLQLVGDGDPHTVIRPEHHATLHRDRAARTHPGRDEAPRSAAPCCASSTIPPSGSAIRRALNRRLALLAAEDVGGGSAVLALEPMRTGWCLG
jgi:hypothetical protein